MYVGVCSCSCSILVVALLIALVWYCKDSHPYAGISILLERVLDVIRRLCEVVHILASASVANCTDGARATADHIVNKTQPQPITRSLKNFWMVIN